MGHAKTNALLGSSGAAYIFESKDLKCKWPNAGVEQRKVGRVVIDTLPKLAVASQYVLQFMCDAASLLIAARKHLVNPLYTDAMHVSSLLYGLNCVGRAMIAQLPLAITTILEKAPWILHLVLVSCLAWHILGMQCAPKVR